MPRPAALAAALCACASAPPHPATSQVDRKAAGLTPMQVVVASTRNGADAMGRLPDLGTLERGKLADLLVLGADPTRDVAAFRSLRAVVRAGILHPQSELRAAPETAR